MDYRVARIEDLLDELCRKLSRTLGSFVNEHGEIDWFTLQKHLHP